MMNTAVQTFEPQRARDFTRDQLKLIKRTVARDTNDDEFDLFIEVCRRVGLNPFQRQIHCAVYSKDDEEKRQLVIITGIDGFRAVAARNGNYRPDDAEAEFEYDESLKGDDNPKGLVKASVKCFQRDPSGDWHPVVAVARWEEFAPLKEDWAYNEEAGKRLPTGKWRLDSKNSFWRKMPNLMLAKCAEAQAIRKGWPEDLSGVYAPEEVHHAATADRSATELVEEAEKENRLQLVGGGDSLFVQWERDGEIAPVPAGEFFDRVCEWIGNCRSVEEIEWWGGINRHALRNFWALAKGDALELKNRVEERAKALSANGHDTEAELISASELAALNAAIERTGTDREKLCESLGVEHLEDLPASGHERAMAAVETEQAA